MRMLLFTARGQRSARSSYYRAWRVALTPLFTVTMTSCPGPRIKRLLTVLSVFHPPPPSHPIDNQGESFLPPLYSSILLSAS